MLNSPTESGYFLRSDSVELENANIEPVPNSDLIERILADPEISNRPEDCGETRVDSEELMNVKIEPEPTYLPLVIENLLAPPEIRKRLVGSVVLIEIDSAEEANENIDPVPEYASVFFSIEFPDILKSSVDSGGFAPNDSVLLINPKIDPEPTYEGVFLTSADPKSLVSAICVGGTPVEDSSAATYETFPLESIIGL
jgi:hypothetical protein